MNLLELQTRANALVQKVNEYEETIAGVELDENTILNEHTYVDLFSLRMIMHRLFGTTPSDRSSNLTTTDGVTWYYLPQSKAGHIYWGNINNNQFGYGSTATTRGRFSDNNDLYTNYNMLVIDPNLSNAWQYSDASGDKERLITTMANTVFGADIRDALVTESQTANIFKWNTTSEDDITSYASAYVVPQQVPGIVCYYLGSGYDGTYTATVPFNTSYSTNQPNNATPALYGAYYIDQNVGPGPSGITSQQAENRGAEGLRMFMPGLTYFNGTSISPINIWQPFPRLDTNYGYNYQGKALYHELVFKRRRAGCKEAGLDFIPDATVDNNICDNDPQGLAMRLALAQQKPYYYNRPWFTELDELYTEDGTKQAALADKIIEDAKIIIYGYNTSDYTAVGTATIDTTTGLLLNPTSTSNATATTTLDMSALTSTTPITDFEIIFKFRLASDLSDTLYCFFAMGEDNKFFRIYLNTSYHLVLQVNKSATSSIGSTIDYSNTLGPLKANKDYYIRLTVNSSGTVFAYYKFNKEDDWTSIGQTTTSSKWRNFSDNPSAMTVPIFGCTNAASFDLKEFYLRINEVEYITPVQQSDEPISSNQMTDSEFYSNYQLDYSTYAEALEEPQ